MPYDNEPSKIDDKIALLIQQARTGRQHFQTAYNNFFDLAAPWRSRVGEKATELDPQAPSEQDNIFDTTLQEAVDDWASDCHDEFTPSYRPWTTYEAIGGTEQFSQASKKKIIEFVTNRMRKVYDRINQSNFEEEVEGCYVDLAIAPTGLDVILTPAGQPLRFEHIPISELLILPSPFGGVGDRFRERQVQWKHLELIWPDADWGKVKTGSMMDTNGTVTVVKALMRDWRNRSEEVWREYLFCEGKIVQTLDPVSGPGSCSMIVARPRVSSPSAYGIGYANKSVPAARVLDEMAYLELKRTGKVIDPSYLFSDDGTFNAEGGIDNGEFVEAGEGFELKSLAPDNDGREAWFVQDKLEATVKRGLFQDGPQQTGDTPPTLGQWMDQKETASRRKGFPRSRISNELVVPTLRRVDWCLMQRKELEAALKVEDELVRFQPISPMSRASDLQEIQMANQHLQMFAGHFGDQAMDYYDVPEMMEEANKKLGGSVVKIRSEDAVTKLRTERAQLEAAASGGLGELPSG